MSSQKRSTAENEWVEIIDPQSKNIIYANPNTGECSWEKPLNAIIKERTPGDEWWELFDAKHNLPYYYNTETCQTEWVRPTKGIIIPLSKIQTSALNQKAKNRNSERMNSSSSSLKSNQGSKFGKSSSSLNNVVQSNRLNSTPKLNIPEEENRPGSMFTLPTGNEFSGSKNENQPARATSFVFATKSTSAVDLAKKNGIGIPSLDPDAAREMSPFNSKPHSPSLYSYEKPKALPKELQSDINKFQIDGFAKKFFSTHKKGLFRRKVPIEKMLVWSAELISQPLISIPKNLHKDALKSFKVIQRVMGDRPISRTQSDNTEIQWLLERGILSGELRDEIFVQLCKQLTENPNLESLKLGWELLSVVVLCFPPSKNFEDYLKSFVQLNTSTSCDEISTMTKYCKTKLDRVCIIGPKGKVLSIAEIQQARRAPFLTSVFGESLETIMGLQAGTFSDLKIPRVLPFLTESILELNGDRSEGIFRVPGDMEMVADLRLRIEKNNYNLQGITDCNVPASLLKQWLRDLEEPLIPASFYDKCLNHTDDVNQAAEVLKELPDINLRIAKYLIRFLQIFAQEDRIHHTKMSVQNLAMVFAPSFLRCPSDNLTQVFANSKLEQEFLRILIVGMELEPFTNKHLS